MTMTITKDRTLTAATARAQIDLIAEREAAAIARAAQWVTRAPRNGRSLTRVDQREPWTPQTDDQTCIGCGCNVPSERPFPICFNCARIAALRMRAYEENTEALTQ